MHIKHERIDGTLIRTHPTRTLRETTREPNTYRVPRHRATGIAHVERERTRRRQAVRNLVAGLAPVR